MVPFFRLSLNKIGCGSTIFCVQARMIVLTFHYLCEVMEKFELHILGCGSALPTTRHFSTSQVVNMRDKLFMIDCGEGAQMQLRKSHLKFSRLNHIFISHLHGDHCFGLPGLISTFGLLGRTADMHIYSPKGLEALYGPILAYFCKGLSYKVIFHEFDTHQQELIFEDRSMTVTTIPLRHRIPCCGFLFAEKPRPRHILREWVDYYKVPVYMLNQIKNGADYLTSEGELIENARLTRSSAPPRSYAYCSDTIYIKELASQLQGVDLLFHEATFTQADAGRARETFHTTAAQAGQVALDAGVGQLVIGHFSARYENEEVLLEEARAIFPNTLMARENACFTL